MCILPARRHAPSSRVLLKEPANSDVAQQDVFKFNAGYTSRMYRVKINYLQMQ